MLQLDDAPTDTEEKYDNVAFDRLVSQRRNGSAKDRKHTQAPTCRRKHNGRTPGLKPMV
jgi:hypothetical protein